MSELMSEAAGAELAAQLEELGQILEERHPQTFHSLGAPATPAALDQLAAALNAPLPPPVRALFAWRDGQALEDPLWGSQWRFMTLSEATAILQSADGAGWDPTWVPVFTNGGGDYVGYETQGQTAGELVEYHHEEPDQPLEFKVPTLLAWAQRACKSRGKSRSGFHGEFPSWTLEDVEFLGTPLERSPGDRAWIKALPAGAVLHGAESARSVRWCARTVVKLGKGAWARTHGFGADEHAAIAESDAIMQRWLEAKGIAPGVECAKDVATANLLESLWAEQDADFYLGWPGTVELDLEALDRKRAKLKDPARITRGADLSQLANSEPLTELTVHNHELTSLAGLEHAPNLKTLHLRGCRELTDLTPLAALEQLDLLTVTRCPKLSDASGWGALAALPALTKLYIERVPVSRAALEPLIPIESLRHVKVYDCSVSYDPGLWQSGGWTPRFEGEWLPRG